MLILSHSVVLDSLQLHGLQPAGLLCPWGFSGTNIGSSCHFLLQGIPGIEPMSSVSPVLQVDYYLLSHHESLLCYRRSASVCVCVCVCVYVCVLVTQSCLILCDPMDCSPTWILSPRNSQVRILEWVAIPFSRVSSWSRDWTQVSCIVGWFFTIWATMKTRVTCYAIENNWKKQNPILKSISTSSPISGSIMPSCVWARNSSSDFKSK